MNCPNCREIGERLPSGLFSCLECGQLYSKNDALEADHERAQSRAEDYVK